MFKSVSPKLGRLLNHLFVFKNIYYIIGPHLQHYDLIDTGV